MRATEAGDKSSSHSTSTVSCVNEQSTTNVSVVEVPASSRKDSKSLSRKKTQQLSRPTSYFYTVIKDIKPGTVVNVFGVVKYVRSANKGRGTGM